MEGKGSDSTATGVEKERTRGKTGTSITAVKQTNAHASSEDHQIPPQSAFLVVTLVAIQLALQTDQLTPLFNSYPLARWPRWAGIAAVIFLSSLVRVGDSLHLLLTMAALTCAFSACMGRDLGSRIGRDLGPEYAPALVSVILALGGLIAAGRVAVGSSRPSAAAAVVRSTALTATLWTGERLGSMFMRATIGCPTCSKIAGDAEVDTLVLAFVYLMLALIANAPGSTRTPQRTKGPRWLSGSLGLSILVVATIKVIQRPSVPFKTPDGSLEILHSVKSNSGRIVVGESTGPGGYSYRYLRADHSVLGGQWVHSAPDGRGGIKKQCYDSIFAAFPLQEVVLLAETHNVTSPSRPKPGESALVIGLGVGIAAAQLQRRNVMVDVVEYDSEVYDAAVKYFEYGQRRPRSKTIADGAKYVREAASAKRLNPAAPRWNYVIQDCFSAGSLPVELFTEEFWTDVQDVITRDGLVVMNFAGLVDSLASRKVIRTLISVFPQCRAFSDSESTDRGVPRNLVFVCSPNFDPLLTFRPATKGDTMGSQIRENIYSNFLQHEVPIDSILQPEDWSNPRLVLHTGDSLSFWEDAKKSWTMIEEILPRQTWMAY